jgi:hypothetical protein
MPRVHDIPGSAKNRTQRSRKTNGSRVFLLPVDARNTIARRYRDIRDAIVSDLGGADNLSAGQLIVIERTAMLSVQCETLDCDVANGKQIDWVHYGKLTDRINRALRSLGRRRSISAKTPDLDTYLTRART